MKHFSRYTLALLAAVPLAAGCGKNDPTLDAAPPPRPGAVAEPNMSTKKNMPGPAGVSGGGGGGAAAQGAGR